MFTICATPGYVMINLTKNMRQKDDQLFTELLNRFRTPSQTEGDIQGIQSWLVQLEDTDYPVSIVFVFLGQFFLYLLFIFHIPKLFFLQWYIFSLLAPLLYSIFFSMFNHQFSSFLSVKYFTWRVFYFSSIFLMASTSEAIPFMFLVYWIGDLSLLL